MANPVHLRGVLKFQINERATLEIDAQRQPVPEEDGQQAGDAKNEREAEKIPLLSQPVDIDFMKKFHAVLRYSKKIKFVILSAAKNPEGATSAFEAGILRVLRPSTPDPE